MKNRTQKPKYCTKTHSFPIKAFTTYFDMLDENVNLYYPSTRIYTSITEINNEASNIEQLMPSENNLIMMDTAVIVPLSLEKLYPLKEVFWQKPTIHYDHGHRLRLFMQALSNLSFYKLVVTPITTNQQIAFIGAIPILAHAPDKAIETFMLNSDFPVEETSKFAAIYEFGKPVHLNLKTGETKDFPKQRAVLRIH